MVKPPEPPARLQAQALGVLDSLIAATYSRERGGHLRVANLELEKLRFGIRLAKDLQHLDFKRYEYAARALDEVGRMVGGWLKSQGAPAVPPSKTPETAPSPVAPDSPTIEGSHGAPA